MKMNAILATDVHLFLNCANFDLRSLNIFFEYFCLNNVDKVPQIRPDLHFPLQSTGAEIMFLAFSKPN